MSIQHPVKAFFAYPSKKPSLVESIQDAVPVLNGGGMVIVKTWEECRIGGKVIIQEICREIDEARLFMADLTTLNANVMFELGYAIAKDKRIWLILDSSFREQREQFKRLRLLTTVGYADCTNSEHIKAAFYKDEPTRDLTHTVFRQAIKPNLRAGEKGSLLYLKSRHENQAAISIYQRLTGSTCPLVVDDPLESATQSLTWYGTQVFNALGVVCHLTDPQRDGMVIESAKYSLVAGMAFGFGKPLILLAEGEFLAPVDYRDLLQPYQDTESAVKRLAAWLEKVEASFRDQELRHPAVSTDLHLENELQSLKFGEHVAENEWEDLVDRYFIETAAYHAALEGSSTIFVGRKGAGKTANLLKLESELSGEARTLVCVIKPVAYEMQGIVDLLSGYSRRDAKGYAIESLWKFLILTEIARSLKRHLEKIPHQAYRDSDHDFLRFVEGHEDLILPEFASRLEACVAALSDVQAVPVSTKVTREAISESLHQTILADLRTRLAGPLDRVSKIAILVDNLDKAWDRNMDVEILTSVILGLLGPAVRVSTDIRKLRRDLELNVSLAVFLRSDIFDRIRASAREPDKLRVHELRWSDHQLLARVIEERFVASREAPTAPEELWSYFCPTVGGVPTKSYILGRVLERPRDLILFVGNAVAAAVNRRHRIVAEGDIEEAERLYSEYAFESLVVESSEMDVDLEAVLFEFAGSPAVVGERDIGTRLRAAGIREEQVSLVLEDLCRLTFLGVEVGPGKFRYSPDERQRRRNSVQARQYADGLGRERRYEVHSAFRSFLEIGEGPS